MNEDFDLVVVITNPDPVEVGISRDLLEQAGIPSQVRNENFGGLYGQGQMRLQRFAEPQLVVFRKDVRRAVDVLDVPLPPGFDDEPRKRRPGLIGWIRWIAGLD